MKHSYPKKHCWSWRYRVRFAPLNSEQMHSLHELCAAACGPTMGLRWDITSVRRVTLNGYLPWYSRVKLHFKHREDLVFFKLSADLSKIGFILE